MTQAEVNGHKIWLCDEAEIMEDAMSYGGARRMGQEIAFRYCPVCGGSGRDNEYSFHVNARTGACNCKRAKCPANGGDYAKLMGRVPEAAFHFEMKKPAYVVKEAEAPTFADPLARIADKPPETYDMYHSLNDSGFLNEAMTQGAERGDHIKWAAAKYKGHEKDGTRFIYQHTVNGAAISMDLSEFVIYCTQNDVPNFVTKNAVREGGEDRRANNNLVPHYMLLEVDDDDSQWKFMELLNRWDLPVSTVTFSGNRSIHAVLPLPKAEYEDPDEYKLTQEAIAKSFAKFGVTIDRSCFDVARLTRVGGATRILPDGAEAEQFDLTAAFEGMPKTWTEWADTEGAKRYLDDADWEPDPEPYLPLEIGKHEEPEKLPDYLAFLLPRSAVLNIAAEAKMGKSLIALDIAAHIAAGKTWAGRFETSKARVLYVDFEMAKSMQFDRMRLMGIDPKELSGDLWLVCSDDIERMRRRSGRSVGDIVRSFVAGVRPDVVILDSAARYFARAGYEDENSNASVLSYFDKEVGHLISQYSGLSVIQIRHTGKASDGQGNKAAARYGRGASAWEDTPDIAFTLTKGKSFENPDGSRYQYFEMNDVRLRTCAMEDTPLKSGALARHVSPDGLISHKWMSLADTSEAVADKEEAELETWREATRSLVHKMTAEELTRARSLKKFGACSIIKLMDKYGVDHPDAGPEDAYRKWLTRNEHRRDIALVISQAFGLTGYEDSEDDESAAEEPAIGTESAEDLD